jgi:hypothetical protein
MRALLESTGHRVAPLDFELGDTPADWQVDERPYTNDPHLKLRVGPYVATSYGMIVEAGPPPSLPRRFQTWCRLLCA